MLRDVTQGYVSAAAAESAYGVVIRNGEIDAHATAAKRREPMARGQGAHFDFGPERVAFEAVWSRQNYAALTEILAALPLHWRFFVKSKIFQAMHSAPAGCEPGRVHEAFAAVRATYPQIRV